MTDDASIARIIDVLESSGSRHRVVALVGASQHILELSGLRPELGDVYLTRRSPPAGLREKIGQAWPGAWSAYCDGMRWRHRNDKGQTRYEALWQRHQIRRAVRDYLDGQNFIEIDTPLLVRGTTPDATIDTFESDGRHLITSSEFQIKRLEVGGFDRLYTLTQNFRRSDGDGRYRNPEFTMLEWARVGASLTTIENDAEALTLAAHRAIGGSGHVLYDDRRVDLTPPWDRLTVREAINCLTGAVLPDFSLSSLQQAASHAGIELRPAWSGDRYVLFSLLIDHIQPTLGTSRPVFVRDWPAFETSSTLEKPDGVAERSELFIAGVEISDGFPTLTDPAQQIRAFDCQNERRVAAGGPPVATDHSYLEGMKAGLPGGAGMALGFDRLVMVLTDRAEIRDVLAFAWDEL